MPSVFHINHPAPACSQWLQTGNTNTLAGPDNAMNQPIAMGIQDIAELK